MDFASEGVAPRQLTAGDEAVADGVPDVGSIIPSLSIDALLARRDAAVACLERIAQAAAEYGEIGKALDLGKGYDHATAKYKWDEPLEGGRHDALPNVAHDGWLEQSRKAVDAALWEYLLALSGLRTFLDAEAKKDWAEAIDKRNTPELTAQNIHDTFRAMHARRDDFFERGVVKVFRRLSWDYKTNKPQRFGKKLIMRYVIDSMGFATQSTCEALDDLIRAMHVLDKKPEPDHRRGAWNALSKSMSLDRREWETDYFHLKTFKNGNGHLVFKRLDLVEDLNRILHNHHPDALPPELR